MCIQPVKIQHMAACRSGDSQPIRRRSRLVSDGNDRWSNVTVRIRPARIDDCPAMGRIVIDATRSAFQERVPGRCLNWLTAEESATNWARNFEPGGYLNRDGRLYVAETSDSPAVGLAMVGPTTASQAHDPLLRQSYPFDLHSLQVAPDWQRQGIGRMLLSKVAMVVPAMSATSLLVRVLQENPNVAFYEQLGGRYLTSQPYDWEGHPTRELLYGWDDVTVLSGETKATGVVTDNARVDRHPA